MFILVREIEKQHECYGNLYLLFIVNVRPDLWEFYQSVLPSQRHKAIDKNSKKNSYIERLNNTLRQRVSRLVFKTLSCSKKLENYVGTIWYFVFHDNASICARYHHCA
ncbi:hypothetical protein CKA32_006964 [Geitlerinema sp. FC II]|nr:hypothetical protein CKA32_006964 [Geitlerinema sp. FC II]